MPKLFDKWAILDHPKVAWRPHRGQLIVGEDYHRHQVLSAGRRFGKSKEGGVDKLLPEIFFTRPLANQLKLDGLRREFWIVGPNFSDSEKEFRVIYDMCKRLNIPMDKPGSYNSPDTGDMRISVWDGACIITAKSAQYPERLVGEGLSGAILSEAAKLKEKIWPKYIRPTLADFNGWSFHSSTPEGKNWFYKLWQSGQDPANKAWKSWRMPAWINQYVYTQTGRLITAGKLPPETPIPPHEFTDEKHVRYLLNLIRENPTLSPFSVAEQRELRIDSEVLENINDLTPEAFLQEIAADFTEFVGRVFKEFDEETHVTDLQFNPNWQSVGAVDYGFTNPNVWLLVQIGPWGEINVLDEVYAPGLDPTQFAAEIKRRNLNPANLHYFYPDPADPAASQILSRILGIQSRSGTGGELNNRINHIRKALRTPRTVVEEPYITHQLDGLDPGTTRPQLMFDRKCVNTIEDMLNYRYPERKDETSTKSQETPMKKADHGPEALGRMFAGIWGSYVRPAGPRVHQATFSKKQEAAVKSKKTFKDEGFMRPAMHERLHGQFPKVNARFGE